MEVSLAANKNLTFTKTEDLPPQRYWTDVKIKKAAIYALAFMVGLTGVALIGVSIAGVIPWPFAFLFPFYFLIAAEIIELALSIKDYEDPKELGKMRQEAQTMSFYDIIKKHRGLPHIIQCGLLPVETLQEKLFTHLQGSTVKNLSPSELQQWKTNGLLREDQYVELQDICLGAKDAQTALAQQKKQIANRYPDRQTILIQSIEEKKESACLKYRRSANGLQSAGFAATNIAYALHQNDPQKTRYENAREQQRILGIGWAATAGMSALSELPLNILLDNELKELDAEIQSIIKNKTGLEEQQNYDKEILEAQNQYAAEKNKLDDQFKQCIRKQSNTISIYPSELKIWPIDGFTWV